MESRKRRRLISQGLGITAALAVVVLIGFGFAPKPIQVVSGKAEKRTLEVTVDEAGKTRIRQRYVISAPVLGNLGRITLKPGDEVKEGDVIGQLSPMIPQLLDDRTRNEASSRVSMSQANAERSRVTIKRADAAVVFAKSEAERLRSLHASQGASRQMLDQAEFNLRAAEEDLAAAKFAQRVANHELGMARAAVESLDGKGGSGPTIPIVSPIGGRVLRVYQESESVVQPGTPLVEIGDPSGLEIVVDVLSTDAIAIQPGAEAHIERWGGPGTLSARVRKKEPSAFTTRSALGVEEQRVPVLLDLTAPPATWQGLGDGYRVETRIQTALVPNAVVVPASAVFRDAGRWATFAVRDGKAEKLELELGARTPDWVEVKKGIEPGRSVILYPSDLVKDGSAVAPEPQRG